MTRLDRRTLRWDGCLNVRDLGGLPLPGGDETPFGRVIRADTVRGLSREGWAALVGAGVGRVVDLRFHQELAADEPGELPVEAVHVPVLPEEDSPDWEEINALGDAAADGPEATRVVYLEWLDRYAVPFAQAVTAVADAPPERAVVVHCHGGKDRTGLVVALLLRLAGVPLEAVAADYALSGANLEPRTAGWIASAEDPRERTRRERIAATPAAAMVAVLEELERRHGDAAGYLRAHGVDEDALARVRARLGPA